MTIKEGSSCPGCGLPNYEGFCPVCRGDDEAYEQELRFAFGPWFPEDKPAPRPPSGSAAKGGGAG